MYVLILWLTYRFMINQRYGQIGSLVVTYLYSELSPLLTQAGRTGAGTADIVLVLMTWILLTLIYKPKVNPWWMVILIMLASQIKVEGIMLVVILGLMDLPWRKKVVLVGVSLIPFVLWQFVIAQLHFFVSYHLILPSLLDVFSRFWVVIDFTSKELVNFKNWYLFWPLFGLSLLLESSFSKMTRRITVPSLIIMMMGYSAAYVFTNLNVDQHVASSIDRVFLQLSPFFIIIMMEKIRRVLKSGYEISVKS
jgi:hypothetical protein